jgi:class 3 adenylate cyclase
MNMCLDYDTENFSDIPESERAKTSVLSQQSDELLRECWKTWRLSSPYRAILYLNLVKSKFDQNELELDDINEAIRSLDRVMKENDISFWAITDVSIALRMLQA